MQIEGDHKIGRRLILLIPLRKRWLVWHHKLTHIPGCGDRGHCLHGASTAPLPPRRTSLVKLSTSLVKLSTSLVKRSTSLVKLAPPGADGWRGAAVVYFL